MNIRGATALVTGATGGLGAVIARALAGAGASVLVSGRRAEQLQDVADAVAGRAIVADLAEPGEPERLLAEAGPVDILVANAALPASGELDSFTTAQIDRALAVNLRAPIILARLLIEPSRERGRGHLVFVCSLAGRSAPPQASLYAATKFGLRGFSLGLRQDLASSGVGVSCVMPGFVTDAGMFADTGVQLPRGVGTSTPAAVAAAVVDAIERDRAEVDVAPLHVALGARIAGIAPNTAARVQARLGASAIANSIGAGQRDKR